MSSNDIWIVVYEMRMWSSIAQFRISSMLLFSDGIATYGKFDYAINTTPSTVLNRGQHTVRVRAVSSRNSRILLWTKANSHLLRNTGSKSQQIPITEAVYCGDGFTTFQYTGRPSLDSFSQKYLLRAAFFRISHIVILFDVKQTLGSLGSCSTISIPTFALLFYWWYEI